MGVISYLYRQDNRTAYDLGKAFADPLREPVRPFPTNGQSHVRRMDPDEWRSAIGKAFEYWSVSPTWLDRVATETFWFCEAADWMVQVRSDAYDNDDEYEDWERVTVEVRSVYDVVEDSATGAEP
jgi:hypothetical protein